MKLLTHAWLWISAALHVRRAPREARWVEPANTITRAIDSGHVGDLPPLRAEHGHRPVTLDDYPELAAALDELKTRSAMQPAPPAPPAREEAPSSNPRRPKVTARHERRVPPVSTRSARRRRHHRAA